MKCAKTVLMCLRKSSFMFKAMLFFCKTKVQMLKFAAVIAKCLANNLYKVHQKYYIILKIMRFL